MSLFNYLTPVPNLFWEVYDRWISKAVVEALETDLHGGVLHHVPRGGRILDLGSGGGQHAVLMAKARPDVSVVGIDISPTMVRRAKARAQREGVADRVRFELGDALEVPFADATFDAVICAGPVKQVEDKPRLLREAYRVLAAGGQLLVMDVDRACGYWTADDFARRTTLPEWAKPILRTYFLSIVAAQSFDLEEARELWALLPVESSDGPRRIPGHPALIMIGRKPAYLGTPSA